MGVQRRSNLKREARGDAARQTATPRPHHKLRAGAVFEQRLVVRHATVRARVAVAARQARTRGVEYLALHWCDAQRRRACRVREGRGCRAGERRGCGDRVVVVVEPSAQPV